MIIRVRDFQALGTAELVAEGLTVVVGPSDRGKSALLRAIEAGLFNRSGEGFVRVGQTSAQVALTFNGDGRDHEVVWEKGGGKNQFNVDGADYSRVGRDAPPVLKALGFRDEVIGARVKEDGKLDGGEMMRPQVARQFDPIFLLDQPGSFINEVMVKLSRLSVLQRANRACSTDLRSAKGQFQFQQQAAQRARETAEVLRPVVALRERIEALCQQAEALGRTAQTIAVLKALVVRRTAVMAVATATVPAVERGPLLRVQQDGLRAVSLRVLVSQRTTYQRRVAPLPGITRWGKSWWKQADSLAPLTGLLTDRRRVAARTGTLPPKRKPLTAAVKTRMLKHGDLRPLVQQRADLQAIVTTATTEAARRDADHTHWGTVLTDFKAKVKVCPTCDRPFV